MVLIRPYSRNDVHAVGILIKDTYSDFNLSFLSPEEMPQYLGPFAQAGSADPEHLEAIHQAIQSDMVFIAEQQGKIAGVLRGRMSRLGSLFIAQEFQSRGIGSALVEKFEEQVFENGGEVIRVASTLFAVPFYTKMGYKKSTGVRRGWSFEGCGIPVQPMRKVLL